MGRGADIDHDDLHDGMDTFFGEMVGVMKYLVIAALLFGAGTLGVAILIALQFV